MRRALLVLTSGVLFSSFFAACSGGSDPRTAPSGTATEAPATAATTRGGTPTPKAGAGGAPSITKVVIQPAQTNELPNVTSTITARAETSDPDMDGVTVEWRWFINGAEIIGESADTLRPGRFKKNDKIEVEGTPKDTRGLVGSPSKASVTVKNATPSITSSPAGSLNGYKVVVQDADTGNPTERHTFSLEPPIPPGFSITADGTLKFDTAAGKAAAGQKVTVLVTDSRGAVAKQTMDVRF